MKTEKTKLTPAQQLEWRLQQVREAHKFIRALQRRAKDYGSDFSSGVDVDCSNFLRDAGLLRESTVVVIPKRKYRHLCESRLRLLKLEADLRRAKG